MVEAAEPDATIVMQAGTYVVSEILRIEKARGRSPAAHVCAGRVARRTPGGPRALTAHGLQTGFDHRGCRGGSG